MQRLVSLHVLSSWSGQQEDVPYLLVWCLQGHCTSCDSRNDAKDYAHIRSAMKILMFSDSEHWDISKLLAAILHLGNVEFQGKFSIAWAYLSSDFMVKVLPCTD